EGEAFAAAIGAEFEVYDDLSDGHVGRDEATAARLAADIRRWRPDVVVAHWRHSIHSDHENASYLAERARFLAGLPTEGEPQHRVRRFLLAENWEDADGFEPTSYVAVPEEAFQVWRRAIQ